MLLLLLLNDDEWEMVLSSGKVIQNLELGDGRYWRLINLIQSDIVFISIMEYMDEWDGIC